MLGVTMVPPTVSYVVDDEEQLTLDNAVPGWPYEAKSSEGHQARRRRREVAYLGGGASPMQAITGDSFPSRDDLFFKPNGCGDAQRDACMQLDSIHPRPVMIKANV